LRLVAVAAALGAAHVPSTAGNGDGDEGKPMLDRVTISGEVHTTESRIEVSFRIENKSAADVFLVDKAYQVGSSGLEARPDHLAVSYDPPATVVLSSKLPPLDPRMTWATPPVTYATRVAPGETYRSTVSARFPLRVEPPFPAAAGADASGTRSVRCNRLRFELGAIPGSADLQPTPLPAAGKAVYQLNALAVKRQKVVTLEQQGAPVDVTVPR
jgi:hypothetical protein